MSPIAGVDEQHTRPQEGVIPGEDLVPVANANVVHAVGQFPFAKLVEHFAARPLMLVNEEFPA